MESVSIYLIRDETGLPRYVGKARDPIKRLASHYRDARRRKTPLCAWLCKCAADRVTPTIETLEVCALEEWPARERAWIAHFRALGPMLNLADGGNEPGCNPATRAANGAMVAKIRQSTPLKLKIWSLNKSMAEGLKAGLASDYAKTLLRAAATKRPDLFGGLLKWL
jgi:hypothetical protein